MKSRPQWLVPSWGERSQEVVNALQEFPRQNPFIIDVHTHTRQNPFVFGFMRSSTKRKPPKLGEGDADRDTPYNADARPTKKGKEEHTPSGGCRRDLPTSTRKPDSMTNLSTYELHDRVPPPRNWRFRLAWPDEPGKRGRFVSPPTFRDRPWEVIQNHGRLVEVHSASGTVRTANGLIRG